MSSLKTLFAWTCIDNNRIIDYSVVISSLRGGEYGQGMNLRDFEQLVASYDCYIDRSKKHHIVRQKNTNLLVARFAISHPTKIALTWAVAAFWEGVKRMDLKPK
ncbi:MAG: hypothetical protein P4L53_26535 [Candidatus Obscuribacterales bacterium]|nr:hypothetical protein [Candidatus Obscuribacterales bacterium]